MMPHDRQSHRQVFVEAWNKARAGLPLAPLEARIVEILRIHPEYHLLLEAPDSILDRDYLPEQGETNPFLHLGLHLTVLEQVSIDQPAGIRALHARLLRAIGDEHAATHAILECLGAALWKLQRDRRPFDPKSYLKCIRRALR